MHELSSEYIHGTLQEVGGDYMHICLHLDKYLHGRAMGHYEMANW